MHHEETANRSRMRDKEKGRENEIERKEAGQEYHSELDYKSKRDQNIPNHCTKNCILFKHLINTNSHAKIYYMAMICLQNFIVKNTFLFEYEMRVAVQK